MAEENVTTKQELLAAIDREWQALQSVLARLEPAQMTSVHDAEGWSVKDHLVHLAAWQRSVVSLLQGKPRHVALGVDASIYARHDYEEINAVIQRQTAAVTLAQAQAELEAVHEQLLALLEPLSDEDLNQPYYHYLPAEADDDRRAIDVIYGNSADHFREHLGWMAVLVAKGLPM